MSRALVLNATYEPLSVVSSRRALCLMIADKAEMIEADDAASIYRIITEAEFVAPEEYRQHYTGFGAAYEANLKQAARKGEIRDGDFETWSWSIMGSIVFLGMRYAEWDDTRPAAEIAEVVVDLLANGIAKGTEK